MFSVDGRTGSPLSLLKPATCDEGLLNCRRGQHDAKEIFSMSKRVAGKGYCKVIEWCRVCGTIIDVDIDERGKSGAVMKREVPQIAQATFDEFNLRK